jgi:flagellar basal body-associated protein FliL
MKELMTSSRSSKATTLALLLVLSLAAVAPAAAVAVDQSTLPEGMEAEAGTQASASVTLTDLYIEPNWDPWTLQGETDLRNVTWTITYIDQTGNEFDTASYDGQELNGGDGVAVSTENDVAKVRVELVGDVPAPETFTYPEKETFTMMSLTQARGEEGSRNDIDSWNVHHYTTGGEADEPGSQQAREAIAKAQGAINSAETAGADTTEANRSLNNAIEFYESGNFGNAVENANTARDQANEAEEQAESSAQTTQLLLYAVVALLLVALIGGGYWYYQQQQSDYDKLG